MANLLTQQRRQHNRRERRLRVVVVTLFFTLALFIIGSIFLVPSYIAAQARQNFLSEQLALLGELIEGRERDETQSIVRMTSMQLETLNNALGAESLISVLERVVSAHTDLVRLLGIRFTREEDGGVLVRLSGTAATRQDLLAFTRRLERQEGVSGVELPVSSLAERTDIPFALSFVIAGDTGVTP